MSDFKNAVKKTIKQTAFKVNKNLQDDFKQKIMSLSNDELRRLEKSPENSVFKDIPKDLLIRMIRREILRRQARLKEDSRLQESEPWNYFTDRHGRKWKNNDEYMVDLTTGKQYNLDGTPVDRDYSSKYVRYYYDVPFSQKEKAKELKMRWDPIKKKWYSSNPNISLFKRVE